MDTFVKKTPRSKLPRSDKIPRPKKSLKQATIESLQGVVVVEDVFHSKSVLELENQSKEKMLETLHRLEEKIPSRQVMVDSKIGHTINTLRKHEDKDIAGAAKKVYLKWRTYFKEKIDKPKIEVRSDLKTEKMREAGRKFIREALGNHHKVLAENIEGEAFQFYKRLISAEYKKTIRKIIFTLRHQEKVKKSTLSGEMKIDELIKLCSKG